MATQFPSRMPDHCRRSKLGRQIPRQGRHTRRGIHLVCLTIAEDQNWVARYLVALEHIRGLQVHIDLLEPGGDLIWARTGRIIIRIVRLLICEQRSSFSLSSFLGRCWSWHWSRHWSWHRSWHWSRRRRTTTAATPPPPKRPPLPPPLPPLSLPPDPLGTAGATVMRLPHISLSWRSAIASCLPLSVSKQTKPNPLKQSDGEIRKR